MGWASMVQQAVGNGLNGWANLYTTSKTAGYDVASELARGYAGMLSSQAQGNAAYAQGMADAANQEAMADYYLRSAGNKQVQGRQERERLGVATGQSNGRIVAQAAGSGMDVTSGTVRKTMKDTVRSLYNDMRTSANNEHEAAYGDIYNQQVAKINAENSRSLAKWNKSAYDAMGQMNYKLGVLGADKAEAAAKSSMKVSFARAATGLF